MFPSQKNVAYDFYFFVTTGIACRLTVLLGTVTKQHTF